MNFIGRKKRKSKIKPKGVDTLLLKGTNIIFRNKLDTYIAIFNFDKWNNIGILVFYNFSEIIIKVNSTILNDINWIDKNFEKCLKELIMISKLGKFKSMSFTIFIALNSTCIKLINKILEKNGFNYDFVISRHLLLLN